MGCYSIAINNPNIIVARDEPVGSQLKTWCRPGIKAPKPSARAHDAFTRNYIKFYYTKGFFYSNKK